MLGLVFLLKILADWQFSRKALEKVDRLTLVVEDKFHKVDNRLKALEEGT